jgi:hypothetical protein
MEDVQTEEDVDIFLPSMIPVLVLKHNHRRLNYERSRQRRELQTSS